MSWFDDAACRGKDVALFFPPLGVNATEAKAICARCPVTAECADYADSVGEFHGVWGGMPAQERKHRRRARGGSVKLRPRYSTLPPGDPRHGTTNGYSNLGCRCDDCRAGASVANAEYQQRIRAERQAS